MLSHSAPPRREEDWLPGPSSASPPRAWPLPLLEHKGSGCGLTPLGWLPVVKVGSEVCDWPCCNQAVVPFLGCTDVTDPISTFCWRSDSVSPFRDLRCFHAGRRQCCWCGEIQTAAAGPHPGPQSLSSCPVHMTRGLLRAAPHSTGVAVALGRGWLGLALKPAGPGTHAGTQGSGKGGGHTCGPQKAQ